MSSRSIFLIRHGESTFNAAYVGTGIDPMLFDAPLSPKGHTQVAEAREAMRTRPVEVVIASPLTRALQTATGIFANHPDRPAISVECGHRERLESSCDRGRPPAELAREFSHLKLDALPETWWHDNGEHDPRGISIEPLETMLARMHDFAAALRARPERNIAVVGHATFFHHLTGRWFNNCEIVPWDGTVTGLEAA